MTTRPFTVGIIQDSASSDAEATLAAAIARVREASALGAQIICLKEIFNAPYFCKAQRAERFDLAEAIPGPTTRVMQRLAKELDVVIIVPLFEKQAPGVYRNSASRPRLPTRMTLLTLPIGDPWRSQKLELGTKK